MHLTEAGGLSLVTLVLLAYWTVLVSELVGDKTIYTLVFLSSRFGTATVFGAMAAAFAVKMSCAAALGRFIGQIHSQWTAPLSAVTFLASALFIWFKEPETATNETWQGNRTQPLLICFASLLLMEWGDPAQIAVAALSIKSHSIVATSLGGTLALVTKGVLAMTLGIKLRAWVPQRALRRLAAAWCGVLGLLALGKLGAGFL